MPRLIAILAVAALLMTGCGGDGGRNGAAGDEIAVDSGSLSRSQFIRRSDAICRARRERVDAEFAAFVERNGGLAASQSDLPSAAKQVVRTIYLPAGEDQIDRIIDLGAPEGDEAEVVAFLEAFQSGLEEAEGHPVRFVRALSADYEPFAEAEGLAAAYGFSECGKG